MPSRSTPSLDATALPVASRLVRHVFLTICLAALLPVGCFSEEETAQPTRPPRDPAEVISEGVSHGDPYVRAETATLLVYAPDSKRGAGQLETLLGDESPLVALAAARTLLQLDPASEAARDTLRRHVETGTPEARIAALRLASDHVDIDTYRSYLDVILRPSVDESVRAAAVNDIVELLDGEDPPDASDARKLEDRLVVLAGDASLEVAIPALRYVISHPRQTQKSRDLRGRLYDLLRGDKNYAYDAYVSAGGGSDLELKKDGGDEDSSEGRESVDGDDSEAESADETDDDAAALARLRALAVIALGMGGDAFRVEELDVLMRRDEDRELQLGAITALVEIEGTDANLALLQALENPTSLVRRHTLALLLETPTRRVQIPEDLLRDDDVEVRIMALELLTRHKQKRFVRVVTQKLGVESFRQPLLEALATWALRGERNTPPWLGALTGTLEDIAEQYGNDPDIAGHLYLLLSRTDGSASLEALLDRFDTLPFTAQYVLLREAARRGMSHSAARDGLASPYFAVQLAAAVGP